MQLVSKPITYLLLLPFLFVLILLPTAIRSEDMSGVRPLRTIPLHQLDAILPKGTHVLIERSAIEAFLIRLEQTPPDWVTVYGHGQHDSGHDERLFNLNRERDAAREGNPLLKRQVAFVWPGELSQFDSEAKGYTVAVGPEFNATSWGLVRFKPEEMPSLRVRPEKKLADRISRSLTKHERVPVFVVMVGALIPSESIIYDFSHDEEGVGLIMPVVRVERVEVLLKRSAP